MDIKSFEPSDETMEKIEERLKELRELREQRVIAANRPRFNFHVGPKVPLELNIPIDEIVEASSEVDDGDTAYTRTLRHESLLKQLEKVTYSEWVASGSKDEFDRLTQHAIELGRLVSLKLESDPDYDDESSARKRLSSGWTKELNVLKQRSRAIKTRNSLLESRLVYTASPATLHISLDEITNPNVSWGIASVRSKGVCVGRAPRSLNLLIENHGLHAELTQTENGPVVIYEPCEDNSLVDNHR
ncbi:hypothetical protein CYD26_21390 [Pseudomonas sp. FFUP_PS_473]|uniref:hypothetical protein n=1 Tax=Pseudomonas sp. FFUP_PS_473 TaxID=2060418 RepID=UPI000C7CF9C4|nr:hypothetical protein [Pseudomonas sp. FFUP_PS_473]PLP87457.1 hypothetical protein CYD26_21390 [Pseudomonas sp. FFUP_PS_473]